MRQDSLTARLSVRGSGGVKRLGVFGERDTEPERSGPKVSPILFCVISSIQPRSNSRSVPPTPPHFFFRLKRGRGPFKACPSLSQNFPVICSLFDPGRPAKLAAELVGAGVDGSGKGAGGSVVGAIGGTRHPLPAAAARVLGREGRRLGARGCRYCGRRVPLGGCARVGEKPGTTGGRLLSHVLSERAGARGVPAGRRGGEGRGPFLPFPPPHSSDVWTS